MMLSQQAINWVVQEVDRQSHVQSVRQLQGSTSSSLYVVTLQTAGTFKNIVLRLFDQVDVVQEEPDVAKHEAASLQHARRIHVQTPDILAFDETGTHCGVPAVLMTYVAGNVDLHPNTMEKWLDHLAEALTHIHSRNVNDFKWTYFPYTDVHTLDIPPWTTEPSAWKHALEIVRQPPPTYQPCFIHRDFHPTNVLWKNAEVSGVVDWVNACVGPAGVDVGHCRVNLALLYGVKEADHFLAAYEKQTKQTFTYDVYWDLASVCNFLTGPLTVYPGWEAFDMTGLTNKQMEERLDAYVKTLME